MIRKRLIPALLSIALLAACENEEVEVILRDEAPRFDVIEATIPEMRAEMEEGRLTSRELVTAYLTRIATYENRFNATLAVNPNALADAERLDRERAEGNVRGPLHGIPIALKDNIHTTDMPTTGGALAFDGFVPPYDATLTANLRDAGAVIIAKTVLTELANWVAGAPYESPDNFSPLGGYAFNPYEPRRDPRVAEEQIWPVMETGGSSSGIGTAANLWAASVGTETSGSVLWPSNQTMLAGIKPTVGRVSRYGIIPITLDQDTAGPMARTVTDAAILLGALEGDDPDPNDPATNRCVAPPGSDYTPFLDANALDGTRIGIPRAGFYEAVPVPGRDRQAGRLSPAAADVMAEAIGILEAQGAVIVDPANMPSALDPDPGRNMLSLGVCGGADGAKGFDDDCSVVFKYGMKRDFDAWLSSLGDRAPVESLAELVAWNREHEASGAIPYQQTRLDISVEMNLEADRERYEADRAKDVELTGAYGIDAALEEHDLDALLFPANRGAWVAAKPGYPSVIVPFGLVPNESEPPFPAGFDPAPMPLGVTFTGTACSEPVLIGLAYAFEQATQRRFPPPLAP
ncbi:MAG TPA: amidase family protein [Gammaproteobacteria bacterium]